MDKILKSKISDFLKFRSTGVNNILKDICGAEGAAEISIFCIRNHGEMLETSYTNQKFLDLAPAKSKIVSKISKKSPIVDCRIVSLCYREYDITTSKSGMWNQNR